MRRPFTTMRHILYYLRRLLRLWPRRAFTSSLHGWTAKWVFRGQQALMGGALIGIAALTLFFTLQVSKELLVYRHCKNNEAALRSTCALAERNYLSQENYLTHLTQDREFLERVVHEQLDYVKPNEVVFKFSNKNAG